MSTIQINPNAKLDPAQIASQLLGSTRFSGGVEYLTPEALLTYVETQLRSIDGDIRKKLQTQNDNITRKKLVQDISAALDLAKNCPELVRDAYRKAIDSLPEGDPLRTKLESLLGATYEFRDGHFDNGLANENKVASQQSEVKNLISDMSQRMDLDMIDIQSLMSQRATAVQIGTGILQKINQSIENTAKNI